ncbi:carbonic anhydrase [Streptomyces flaveolus]|uniref:carbonic anhydrase n=1 Tax=Streptomyces flaveolus TaxID=67297 RepID=UPI003412DE32
MSDDISGGLVGPREALDLLLSGNQRFIDGVPEHPNQDAARRTGTVTAQHPYAVLLGCSDSRLAAEIIFDQGLGDLFVVRTAGHAVGAEVLGSVEYGTSVLGCPLVVVLGHDACGAVAATRAAVENGTTAQGYVRDVIERVTPSVLAARAAGVSSDDGFVDTHVRYTVDVIMERSRELADQVDSGRTAVVGLSYRLAEGSVRPVTSRGLDLPSTPAPAAAPGSDSR